MYSILSEQEKRELTRFLGSSYFNRDKSLLQFHQFLSNDRPLPERYDKRAAWKFVFAKAAFNEKKFRYMVSDLLAAIEEFIYTHLALHAKPGYVQYLHQYYTLHGADENRLSLAVKIENSNKKEKPVMGPAYFLEKHFENELLEEINTTSLKSYRRYVSDKRNGEPGELDCYYVIEKLRQMCIVANDNNVLGLNASSFFEADVLKLAAQKKISGNFFVASYFNVFELLTKGKDDNYYRLKKLLNEHGYEMEDSNMAELLTYARNFCISKINAGQSAFFEELFDLYKQGLSKGALLPNGEINERNYKNIVTTALRTGKYDWAFDFINDYRYRLNKVVRENAFNYNLANYFFHTGKYDKVLQNLQKVQLADLFYGLDARSLMIKCYYELDEKEAFMNAYYSFRVFVQRRKNVSQQHRKNYLNFLRIAKKLMNLRPANKKAIQNLNSEIKNSTAIADKSWLEEKMRVYL